MMIDKKIKPVRNKFLSGIKRNFSLAALTSFKIGGRAEFFLEVETVAELISALKWSRQKRLAVRWLAGGSNLLVKDGNIGGLVIKIKLTDLKIDGHCLSAGAGLNMAAAVKAAYGNGLSGLEWAAGLPGSLGGAIRGNAGAFGQDIGRTVESVEAVDIKKLSAVSFNRRQCKFSYRDSIFKQKNGLIICRAKLSLVRRRRDLIKNLMAGNIKYRAVSQPGEPSAGSVFKNIEAAGLKRKNKRLYDLAVKEKKIKQDKIPAAWIIDRLGLKNLARGGAKVSFKHANFIVNSGQASCGDVKKLINHIKKEVYSKFKINLTEEIQRFGE